ncbi:MAG: HAMP domain-containing histidine kinase [Planctomycetes bacterium]|nr:HAMP domain-containing histidine kinase [Planctomycetota bacterium]
MKLAFRLVAFLVLILAVLVAVDGFREYGQERALMREDMQRDARVLGMAMSSVLDDVWRADGMPRCLQLIADANRAEADTALRWVWFDAAAGDPFAPAVATPADVAASVAGGDFIEGAASGANRLYMYFAIDTAGGGRGGLELSRSMAALSQRGARVLLRSTSHLVGLFLIAVLVVYFIGVRLIGRPLHELAAKIDSIGRGDLSHPLRLGRRDELSLVAAGLNTMCGRLVESQRRIAEESAAKIAALEAARHADRLRTVGQLASGVAHELGTPLNVVSGRAALIAGGRLGAAEVLASAGIIGAQADRMTGIIRQLLVFARRGTSGRERVDVRMLVRESLALVQPTARKKGVSIEIVGDVDDPAGVDGNPSELQQVLTNLEINAIQASGEGDVVRLEVSAEAAVRPGDDAATPRPCVRVDVRDDGEGIPADKLPRIFEPFFTTKDVGEGTGLGLSIVHGILRDHDGWITVTSDPGAGSCFTFHLPASE